MQISKISILDERFEIFHQNLVKRNKLMMIVMIINAGILFLQIELEYFLVYGLITSVFAQLIFLFLSRKIILNCPHCEIRTISFLCKNCFLPTQKKMHEESLKYSLDMKKIYTLERALMFSQIKFMLLSSFVALVLAFTTVNLTKLILIQILNVEIVILDEHTVGGLILISMIIGIVVFLINNEHFKSSKINKVDLDCVYRFKAKYTGFAYNSSTRAKKSRQWQRALLLSIVFFLYITFSNLSYITLDQNKLSINLVDENTNESLIKEIQLSSISRIYLVIREQATETNKQENYFLIDLKTDNKEQTIKLRVPSSIGDVEADEIVQHLKSKTVVATVKMP